MSQADRGAAQFRESGTGSVAAATSWLTGSYLLPDIIAEFQHKHPGVRVSRQLGTAAQAIDLVRSNRAELAFVAGAINAAISREEGSATRDAANVALARLNIVPQRRLVTRAAPTPTWKRQLDLPAPGIAGNPTIRQFLEGLTSTAPLAVTALGDFRNSLAHLQGLDSERLQYLMQGTLDLSMHRLDAWITSFASKRPSAMMTEIPGSVSYARVGDVLVAHGNLGKALNSYRDSLGISQRLAKAAPNNAGCSANAALRRSPWSAPVASTPW